jgi:hypothetical protein
MIKTRQELIEGPSDLRPHIVLLGAGASRAAFPQGDAAGRRLPVMDDLVDMVGLQPLIEQAGLEDAQERNFEVIYGRLASEPGYAQKVREIERRIDSYFVSLSLPSHATIYDRLLVSLRPTDAVFTFNWDPFLFDAYQRNRNAVPLPEIFFLHGNVRIGACLEHDKWGRTEGAMPRVLSTIGRCPAALSNWAEGLFHRPLYPTKLARSENPVPGGVHADDLWIWRSSVGQGCSGVVAVGMDWSERQNFRAYRDYRHR